jgi:predicted transcriptional regulator
MPSTINDAGTDGTTKTSIMYKSFLSYAQLKEYLSFTLEKGLVGEFPQKIETRLGTDHAILLLTSSKK